MPAGYERKHGITCGWVTVARRPGQAGGKTIRLWTARILGIGSEQHDDPILYINGGPGVATVDEILPHLDESKTMAVLRQGRDVILFDQRGSGRSDEALCPDLAKSLNAIESAGLAPEDEAVRSRAAYVACKNAARQKGFDLDAYTTSATVADMEGIRAAFGIAQWNLAAISYGSLVALHAMRTVPQTIRSAILNSPYPPNSGTWAEQASIAAAAYSAIDRECSAQAQCRASFGAVLPKLEATLARLERTPLIDGKTRITGRQFAKALWPMAVRSATVKLVPLAIHRAHSGDEAMIKKMVAMFAGGDSFSGYSPAQAYAISCYESGRTTEWYARARALYPALTPPDPVDGWDKLCAAFRPGFADPGFFAPVASAIPTLVYAGSLDPATPVVDAYHTIRFLSRATLVEVPGAAHGPIAIDDCTRGIASEFLANPGIGPDLGCMAKRPVAEFATDGLDEVLQAK